MSEEIKYVRVKDDVIVLVGSAPQSGEIPVAKDMSGDLGFIPKSAMLAVCTMVSSIIKLQLRNCSLL